MPPKNASKSTAAPATPSGDGRKLTDTDVKMLQLAWQCFETMPKVDTAKLAHLSGHKNAASANTAYSNARRKLFDGVKLPPAEKTPKKKAASAAGGGDEDDAEEAEAAPVDTPVPASTKKGNAAPRKRKSTAPAEEDGEGEENGEEGEATPAKEQKKGRAAAGSRKKKQKVEVKEDEEATEEAEAESAEGGTAQEETIKEESAESAEEGEIDEAGEELNVNAEKPDDDELAGTV
ncbi:hypothetical protein CERZMDRAFT_85708 [Cercospora zeae-maydis SCOH1-5]|uniref:Uncharacterized protein n=1 Tax=Cercospora zeae-maydis SCOH1-5 TaxID=717836 RepID=A0A6A6FCM7_9PEZI|nr:hypothetical protein CERZMDRAFT_85708 [Cercospora zeae-maydis SCOH1-5]